MIVNVFDNNHYPKIGGVTMKRFLKYEAAAEFLDVSGSYLKKKIHDGTFRLNVHYFKPNGSTGIIRFDAIELEKWMRGKDIAHEALQQSGDSVSDVLSRVRPSPKKYGAT